MLIIILMSNFFLVEIPFLCSIYETQASAIIYVKYQTHSRCSAIDGTFPFVSTWGLGSLGNIFRREWVYGQRTDFLRCWYRFQPKQSMESLLCNSIITYIQTQQLARSLWPSLRQIVLLESLPSSSCLVNVVSGACRNPATFVRLFMFSLHSGTQLI